MTNIVRFTGFLCLAVISSVIRQTASQNEIPSCSLSPFIQCERVLRSFIGLDNSGRNPSFLRSRCPEVVEAAQCVQDYYDNCIFDIFRPIGEAFIGGARSLVNLVCLGNPNGFTNGFTNGVSNTGFVQPVEPQPPVITTTTTEPPTTISTPEDNNQTTTIEPST